MLNIFYSTCDYHKKRTVQDRKTNLICYNFDTLIIDTLIFVLLSEQHFHHTNYSYLLFILCGKFIYGKKWKCNKLI